LRKLPSGGLATLAQVVIFSSARAVAILAFAPVAFIGGAAPSAHTPFASATNKTPLSDDG
jgi:hypothetical protein